MEAESIAAALFTPWATFLRADIVVKGVLIILVVMSVWGWAIIFDRWFALRMCRSRATSFEKDFWKSDDLEQFANSGLKPNHPLARLFAAIMRSWERVDRPRLLRPPPRQDHRHRGHP